MLIRFTVKNFASFLEEQSLSMVKGKETKLASHVNEDAAAGFKTLRGAVIYGANASGKSNLIKAIDYAHDFIVHNRKRDQAEQFRLDVKALEHPSSFNFEFKINDKAYSYGFESKGTNVISEWLYEIFSNKDDKLLFERLKKSRDKANINFGPTVIQSLNSESEKNDLEATARTTPDDTLFLHDAHRRNINLFQDAFEWFEERLVVLHPSSIEPFITQDGKLIDFLDRILKAADVGIVGVELAKDEDFAKAFIPQKIAEEIDKNFKDESDIALIKTPYRGTVVIAKENGKLSFSRLVTLRKDRSGEIVKFELSEESDGTRRLIELAPAFLSKASSKRILVVDEMDRSLHPMITEMLHQLHYNDPNRANAQMILATHEHYLLSQEFYRRDEIWFVEKDEFGASKLKSLSEYKVRHDKDIEKDYLLGRYGATPYIRKLYAEAY